VDYNVKDNIGGVAVMVVMVIIAAAAVVICVAVVFIGCLCLRRYK